MTRFGGEPMKIMRIVAGFMVFAMAVSLTGCDKILPPRATAMTTESTVVTTELTTESTKPSAETSPTTKEPKTASESLVGVWIGANYNSYPGGILEFKSDGSFVYRELRKKAGTDVDPDLDIRTTYKAADKDEHTCTVDLAASGEKKFGQLECKIDGHKLRITGLPYAAEGMHFDFYNNSIESASKSRDTNLFGEWVFYGTNNKKVANTEDERLEIYEDIPPNTRAIFPVTRRKRTAVRLIFSIMLSTTGTEVTC